jgi:hypothetical protein
MTDLPLAVMPREVTWGHLRSLKVTCVTHEMSDGARSMEVIVWSVNSGKYSVNPRLTLYRILSRVLIECNIEFDTVDYGHRL